MFLERCLTLGMLAYGSKTGHFDWECANVLSGTHDAYSIDGAKDFRIAAINEGIDVCPVSYTANSADMRNTIKRLSSPDCGCSVCRCRVNVIFGQYQDLTSLFHEAHVQNYEGEWLVGDNILASLDDVINDLTSKLKDDSSVHKILEGTSTPTISFMLSSPSDCTLEIIKTALNTHIIPLFCCRNNIYRCQTIQKCSISRF